MRNIVIWSLLLALLLMGCGSAGAPAAEPETPTTVPEQTDTLPEPEAAVPEEPEVPTTDAVPDPEQVDLSYISVTHETDYQENVTMTVTATDLNTGEVLWTYTTPELIAAQLTGCELIGVANDLVYVNQQVYADGTEPTGHLVALDLLTGQEIWRNGDFHGASTYHVFGPEGNLYITGYFGPDCFAVDKDGQTLWQVDTMDPALYWPCEITLAGDVLTIGFEGNDQGDGLVHHVPLGTDGTVSWPD